MGVTREQVRWRLHSTPTLCPSIFKRESPLFRIRTRIHPALHGNFTILFTFFYLWVSFGAAISFRICNFDLRWFIITDEMYWPYAIYYRIRSQCDVILHQCNFQFFQSFLQQFNVVLQADEHLYNISERQLSRFRHLLAVFSSLAQLLVFCALWYVVSTVTLKWSRFFNFV